MNIYTIHPHSLTATVTLGSVLLDDISGHAVYPNDIGTGKSYY